VEQTEEGGGTPVGCTLLPAWAGNVAGGGVEGGEGGGHGDGWRASGHSWPLKEKAIYFWC